MYSYYLYNKKAYFQLTEDIQKITNLSGSSGGGNKWTMFDKIDKEEIINSYNNVIFSDKPCSKIPLNLLKQATRGVTLRHENSSRKPTVRRSLCRLITEIQNDNNNYPFVRNDSLTGWAHQGVMKYGLTVGDILKMKFGEKTELILMDRNSGSEDIDHIPIGNKFKPTKYGFTYATYIHATNLTGIMLLRKFNIVYAPFHWELNRTAIRDDKYSWAPIPIEQYEKDNKIKDNVLNIHDLDKNIFVGWRGPSIKLTDCKNLPKYVVKYGTSWDDDLWWGDRLSQYTSK